MSKNPDLQQLSSDTHIRPEPKKASINVPSTTERLLKHRHRIQENVNTKATSRSFQSLFPESNFNPTQRTQASTAFEKRRKNLVQLIANNFGNVPTRTTQPTYTQASTYRTTAPPGDYNSIREMQVAAETASFANNNNRQFLQDYNNKNFRPYPVYTPNLTARLSKAKSNPTLTTLYDFRDKNINPANESTSKRPTLVPYTKSYTSSLNDKREPYTRPGVSLLKEFLVKEKNKTASTTTTTTEKVIEATERFDYYGNKNNIGNKVTVETKDTYESVTKIPQTTRPDNNYHRQTASSERLDVYSSTNQFSPTTTESSYQGRRERLMRKLNLDAFSPTEATAQSTITEKFYGDLPNRPGLVVPPSLTPKTLHTLAIYYATALDNLSTTTSPQETETTTGAFDEYETNEDGIPPFALFSQHTINKYSNLFAQGMQNPELLEELKLDPNGTYNELAEDLTVQQSQNPIATSPQIRELAQVFTHALSAYLQDPVQFRKVLSDIRPTHPSFGDMLITTEEPSNTEPTTTVNEEDDEILGFSDDNKIRPALASLRDPKSLNIATDYTNISEELTTTQKPYTPETSTFVLTTPSSPFRCCGKISASYTSASAPDAATTPVPFTNTVATSVNTLVNNFTDSQSTTTENSYIPKYGGFQNNSQINNSPYGRGVNPVDARPLSEYVEVTNLPTAWGVDASIVSSPPASNSQANIFESKKIRTTTTFPATTAVYFTETDSIELENEEELQRAHSQSFVTPQSNNLRQGKQINIDEAKTTVRKPSEELEAPTLPDFDVTTVQTTIAPITTIKTDDTESFTTVSPFSGNVFTSPEVDKTTYHFQWPSTYESWQSTVIDPITLNDNLSPSGPEQSSQPVVRQTNSWINNAATTPATEYTGTSEQSYSSSDTVQLTTHGTRNDDRIGKLLRDPTSTEAAQDLTTITETVVEKAKEIMGGMNATTTEKLMNVMKKTKSKTVRRLILLLIQTCDDDHNTTAEASKKALLEALMAVSQKDMDEIIKEDVTDAPTTEADIETARTNDPIRNSDRVNERPEIRSRLTDRRGKSLNFDPNAINSLSNPSTPENIKPSEFTIESVTTTQFPKTSSNRRGTKKFLIRTSPVNASVTKPPAAGVDSPIAEARTAAQTTDLKTAADTRALELLRSLYTIAARWG